TGRSLVLRLSEGRTDRKPATSFANSHEFRGISRNSWRSFFVWGEPISARGFGMPFFPGFEVTGSARIIDIPARGVCVLSQHQQSQRNHAIRARHIFVIDLIPM